MYSYLVRAPRVFSLHLSWAFWLPDLWASLEKGAGVWFLNELLENLLCRAQWGSLLSLGVAFKHTVSFSVPSCSWLASGCFPPWQPWTCPIAEDSCNDLASPVCCQRSCPAHLTQIHEKMPLSGRVLSSLLCPHPWLLAYKRAYTYLSMQSYIFELFFVPFSTPLCCHSGCQWLWNIDLPVNSTF